MPCHTQPAHARQSTGHTGAALITSPTLTSWAVARSCPGPQPCGTLGASVVIQPNASGASGLFAFPVKSDTVPDKVFARMPGAQPCGGTMGEPVVIQPTVSGASGLFAFPVKSDTVPDKVFARMPGAQPCGGTMGEPVVIQPTVSGASGLFACPVRSDSVLAMFSLIQFKLFHTPGQLCTLLGRAGSWYCCSKFGVCNLICSTLICLGYFLDLTLVGCPGFEENLHEGLST